MNDLVVQHAFGPPSLTWRWRSAGGEKRRPADMATSHLFHTFRMIWNHSMPFTVGNVKRYRFGPSYTAAYMADAIRFIGAELARRDDLTAQQEAELAMMADFFRNRLDSGHQRLT